MRLRAPSLDEAEKAFEVSAARDMADVGTIVHTLKDLLDFWRLSEFDISADARLVEDRAGQVVGYGMVVDDGAFGAIRPEAEGRGAGSALLDWIEQRERERGRSVHRQAVAAANRAAAAFLPSRGYSLTRSNYRMIRPLTGAVETWELEEVTLRLPEPADLEAMHAVDARAFADDPGYVPGSVAQFREEHLEAHDVAPELSRVALAEDRLVGFLLVRRRENESVGYVDLLAVDPDHQGKGIGRALLLDAFQSFAAAGLQQAQLGVSSVNAPALNLYKSAGMTPRFQHDIYERPTA